MKYTISIVGLATIFVFGFSTSGFACSCDRAPNPPCRAYGTTSVIFDGVVEKFEDLGPNWRRATFKVNTLYKGTETDEVIVNTGDGGSDCGFPFEVGKRYIVYASESDGGMFTSYCTRTRLLGDATEDTQYFSKRSSLKDGGLIFGSVKKFALGYGDDEDFGLTSPIPNILISLKGPRSAVLRTDAKGEFKAPDFPAGEYLIEAKLPRNLRFSGNTLTMPVEILTLENKGCVGAKYYVEFEGAISGRVVDEKGAGSKGFDVTLVRADYKFKGPDDTGPLLDWAVSRQDGSYVLDGIPPGRYRLGIGIGGAFDSFGKNGQIFYPNTTDPEKAKIITIIEGQKLRNINIPIPKKL